ncbi:hypothetical protein KI387_018987, partial [Taxus chinensis]
KMDKPSKAKYGTGLQNAVASGIPVAEDDNTGAQCLNLLARLETRRPVARVLFPVPKNDKAGAQCLNLLALLETSMPTTKLFLPTADQVKWETPAEDFLSSFDRRKPSDPPRPDTPAPIIPSPIISRPRQSLNHSAINLPTGKREKAPRVNLADNPTSLASSQAQKLVASHNVLCRQNVPPSNNPAPTTPRRPLGVQYLSAKNLFRSLADVMKVDFPTAVSHYRGSNDKKQQKSPADRMRVNLADNPASSQAQNLVGLSHNVLYRQNVHPSNNPATTTPRRPLGLQYPFAKNTRTGRVFSR